jgi:hypothetical protein
MAVDPDTMITLLETFLQTSVGVSSIKHPDGRTITMDRGQAMTELSYWQSVKSQQARGGLVMSRLNLKGDA